MDDSQHWKISADFIRRLVEKKGLDPISRAQAGTIRNGLAESIGMSDEAFSMHLVAFYETEVFLGRKAAGWRS